MNSDTVVNALQARGNAPLVQSVWALSSVEQLFNTPTGYLGAQVPLVLSVPNQSTLSYNTSGVASGSGAGDGSGNSLAGIAGLVQEWTADGRPFGITIVGKVAPITVSGVLQLWLQAGNGVAGGNPGLPGNPTNIVLYHINETLSASNPFDTNFTLSFEMLWDSTSNVLNGQLVSGQIANNLLAQAVTAQITNCQMAPLQFTLGASLSLQNSNAVTPPATITLNEFSAYRI